MPCVYSSNLTISEGVGATHAIVFHRCGVHSTFVVSLCCGSMGEYVGQVFNIQLFLLGF